MRIQVDPERLAELSGRCLEVASGLADVEYRCRSALDSLDWEVRQRAGVEKRVWTAVVDARFLSDRAEAMARFLRDAAKRFAEADRQELHLMGWIMGSRLPLPPPSILSIPDLLPGILINFVPPYLEVPRVVPLAGGGVVLGGLTIGGLAPVLPDFLERVWNWLRGNGWKTDKELSQPPTTPKPGQTETSQPTTGPASSGPLTAARDAAHPLTPADPVNFDPHVGCVNYATTRRPDLKEFRVVGAADYIDYYEKKGQTRHLQGTEADLRQVVKPGYAVVWPRGHEDLKGTAGWDFGHIAIVEEVYPDYVVVSQAGWPGKPQMKIPKEHLQSLVLIL